MPAATPEAPLVLVKRYDGRRLYDTAAGRYLTADELRHWARRGVRFVVVEAATGRDITALVAGGNPA